MNPLCAALLLFAAAPHPTAAAARAPVAQDHAVKLAPFDALRWPAGADERPEVRVAGEWYGWRALDGVAVADIVAECKARWPSRWQKRVGEDLVEVLVLMGHAPGETVELALTKLGSGEELVLADVAMTAANRRAVRDFNQAGGLEPTASATPAVKRIAREHATSIAPAFAALARALEFDGWAASRTLSRAQAEEDLDQLEWAIEHTHSYRDLRGVDRHAAFDAVRATLPESIALEAFALRLMELVALFGDAHAGLRGGDELLPGACLPFLMEETDAGVVAFQPDRSALLDPKRPFVVALDERPLDEWIAAVSAISAPGTVASMRFRALRNLRRFDWARLELGLPIGGELKVELADERGRSRRTLELELAARKPAYGVWPRRPSELIDGDVGYLRIASMESDPAALTALEDAMATFRETRALVIDVRGNGGGSRDALRTLLPYFLAPEASTRVVNVAAYRLAPGEPRDAVEGYMPDRYLFPRSSGRWSPEEGAAIDACHAGFKPDWTPPAADFSAWHWFVVGARDGSARVFHYERPVAVLMDGGCFSATDIFLGAFAGLPGVTLMGSPSGGGSGRVQALRLAHSGLEFRLSSMVSFRPDGRRYDGKGIEPDVRVATLASDLVEGGTDAVLAAALEHLRKQSAR